MAEIEFKRRGTPLWAVLLVLLVIAGVAWAIFGRGRDGAAVAADSSTAPAGAASGRPAAPVPLAPLPALSAWVDSAKAPKTDAEIAAYVSAGLRIAVVALVERAPMAGAQHVLIRAMADTLALPDTPPHKQLDAAQAAFFGFAYALRETPGGERLTGVSSRMSMSKPLAAQTREIKLFFETARDVLSDSVLSRPVSATPKT